MQPPSQRRRGRSQTETLLGEASFSPCPSVGQCKELSTSREVHMGAHTTAGQRPLLLHWDWLCWPPARLSSMEEAAPLLFLSTGTLCFVSWGQVRHCSGMGIGGLRAVAEPGWTRWQGDEIKKHWCIGSFI